MTRSNNTTRARAHEAKVKQVLQAYQKATGRWPETTKEMADAHDRSYRAMWSGPDTEPEDSIDTWADSERVHMLTLVAFTILAMAFGLGIGYLLFHP